MARTSARMVRALIAAGGIALVCASAATAATFKNDSGKLVASKVSGVSASGGALKFTGKANPTGSTKFAGQIAFASGMATGLNAPGKLTLTHSGKTATLKIAGISGTTLTASLGSKSLSFPLDLSGAKSTPNSSFTSVSVTGVVVKLSSADATALKNALKTSAYKSGGKLGKLSYNGNDRELIEVAGGPLTLCNDKKFSNKNTKNGIAVSPVSPATVNTTDCTGPNDMGVGLNFTETGKPLGFLDTATRDGRITLHGGIQDQQSSSGTTGQFKSPILDLLGTNSDLRATVVDNGNSIGQETLATVAFTTMPKVKITESGGTLTVAPDGSTVALNSTGAELLNFAFCTSSSCPGGQYATGEAIGYSGGTTTFK